MGVFSVWQGPGLTFLLQLLHVPQLLHVVGVTQPQLHAHEGLPALQAQLVPGLGPRQQVRHGALCQPQDALTKQPLPWGQGRGQLSPQASHREPLPGESEEDQAREGGPALFLHKRLGRVDTGK